MKTKYKILIISVMVLSIITCFAITSFAVITTDITYNNITYTYDGLLNTNNNNWVTITGLTKIEIKQDSDTTIYTNTTNSDVTMYLDNAYNGPEGMLSGLQFELYAGSNLVVGNNTSIYNLMTGNENDNINIILYGDYTIYSHNINNGQNTEITNVADSSQYNAYQANEYFDAQYNLLNANQPNPLEKVDDFLTYLSTSLNKLTTMIITNQILILFIVAVPVVSFVIGSFKRIKDSGRV